MDKQKTSAPTQLARRLGAWLAVLLLTCAATAFAADEQPIVKRGLDLIKDTTHLLSDEELNGLDLRLSSIHSGRQGHIAVLVTNDIGDESPQHYAQRVIADWKLGTNGANDALLILVLPDKNAVYLEVGADLKGIVPDAQVQQWSNTLVVALKNKQLPMALNGVLDQLLRLLPRKAQTSIRSRGIFDQHPEWALPFVLVAFSPFPVLLVFAGRVAAALAAVILAGMYGFAAWAFWQSNLVGYVAGAIAFALPLLWRLNMEPASRIGAIGRFASGFGNLCAVLLCFTVVTLLAWLGVVTAQVKELWAAPLFGLVMASGMAVFLFPGAPARYLMVYLRSLLQFVFGLAMAYLALQPTRADALELALMVAVVFTGVSAIGLLLDSREQRDAAAQAAFRISKRRWSPWFLTAAVLLIAPFTLVTLYHAVF